MSGETGKTDSREKTLEDRIIDLFNQQFKMVEDRLSEVSASLTSSEVERAKATERHIGFEKLVMLNFSHGEKIMDDLQADVKGLKDAVGKFSMNGNGQHPDEKKEEIEQKKRIRWWVWFIGFLLENSFLRNILFSVLGSALAIPVIRWLYFNYVVPAAHP